MDPAELRQLDPDRLTAWHAEYADRLRAFVFGLLRNHTAVDEVVQSAFAKALTHGADVQPGSERAWLFQVAFHEAMALRRRSGIHERSLKKLTLNQGHPFRPDDPLLQQETVNHVRSAVNELPEELKQIVLRRMYDEQTFQEIADDLKTPLGTVLTRMRLALQKLRKALKDD